MTEIAFTGDLTFTKYLQNAWNDENLLDAEIVRFLNSADHTVVNVEGAISAGTTRTDKPLVHANPAGCVHWLKKINGDIWSLANNHSMDSGYDGFEGTMAAAKTCGVQTVGIGANLEEAKRPVVIAREGGIAIIALTYFRQNRADDATPGCLIAEDEDLVRQVIQDAKSRNRWCIVVSHVGQEFSSMPMPFLRKRYLRYLSYGADIIIGHHSHVVQSYEKVGEKTIFYSLGNFVFDTDYQRIQSYTENGMLIKLRFDESGYSWENMPVRLDRRELKIYPTETPAIFTGISDFQYRLLWPLAARQLCKNERKKYIFHKPHMAKYSWLQWLLKWEIPLCKDADRGWDILRGRMLAMFGAWRLGNPKLIQYIKEDEDYGV